MFSFCALISASCALGPLRQHDVHLPRAKRTMSYRCRRTFATADSGRPIRHWSQVWGSLGVPLFLMSVPIRKVGVPCLQRLSEAHMSVLEATLGVGIVGIISAKRTKFFASVVAPRIVSRAFDLDSSAPPHHQLLAPLVGVGILPFTKGSIAFVCAAPFLIFVLRTLASKGWVIADFFFASIMFLGLLPMALSIIIRVFYRLAASSS